jgi:hypothetical protein
VGLDSLVFVAVSASASSRATAGHRRKAIRLDLIRLALDQPKELPLTVEAVRENV